MPASGSSAASAESTAPVALASGSSAAPAESPTPVMPASGSSAASAESTAPVALASGSSAAPAESPTPVMPASGSSAAPAESPAPAVIVARDPIPDTRQPDPHVTSAPTTPRDELSLAENLVAVQTQLEAPANMSAAATSSSSAPAALAPTSAPTSSAPAAPTSDGSIITAFTSLFTFFSSSAPLAAPTATRKPTDNRLPSGWVEEDLEGSLVNIKPDPSYLNVNVTNLGENTSPVISTHTSPEMTPLTLSPISQRSPATSPALSPRAEGNTSPTHRTRSPSRQ